MKKVFIIILFSFVIVFLSVIVFLIEKKQDNSFVLKGQIENVDSGIIKLNYINAYSQYIRDTAIIINGRFEFQGYISEPTKVKLIDEKESSQMAIFLDPTFMKVFIPNGNFNEIVLTGSKTQDEFDKLKQFNSGFDFIVSEPKSYVSLDVLEDYLFSRKYEDELLDSLNSLFGSLDSSVQNSKKGKEVKWELSKRSQNRVGDFAVDFLEKDINGNEIKLSDFRNKNVVLLDFWASWCIPCRSAFPFVKSIYEKYHSLGLEVIAISSDYDKEEWIKAVNEDGVDIWRQILKADPIELQPGQFFGTFIRENSIRDNYYNELIPSYYLIDKEGKIAGRWIGINDEVKKEIIQKLDEIF